MIEITLQNHLRSDLIDLTARRPRGVSRFPQGAVCRDRREAFVPCHDRTCNSGAKFLRKLQCLFSGRTETAVHVSRQSENDLLNVFFPNDCRDTRHQFFFAFSRKRFQRMRKQTEFVGNCETDTRLSKIETEQSLHRSTSRSLQFRRNFGDEVLDLFRLMPVTNEQRILRAHDDQVVHAEQRDVRAILIRNDVAVESIAVIGQLLALFCSSLLK